MPKGLKRVKKKLASGEVRIHWYHRATGNTPLKHDPETAAGFAEIAALDKKAKAIEPVGGFKPGTFAALWLDYRGDPTRKEEFPGSPEWRALKPRTKSDYQKVRDWLGPAAERAIVKTMTADDIIRLRDRADAQRGRRFANYVVQVVRLVLAWGMPRRWLGDQANPATGVKLLKKPKGQKKLNRAWTPAEVAAFVADDCPFHLLVPFCLGLFAGMREGDALVVTRRAYNGATLNWIASKNDEACAAPVTGAFKIVLDRAIAIKGLAVQLAVNSRGLPWTESGFRSSFFKRIAKLKAAGRVEDGCTFHGLRHTIGTFARNQGESNYRVAAAIGDRTTAMADIYARDADRQSAAHLVLIDVQRSFSNFNKPAALAPPATPGQRDDG